MNILLSQSRRGKFALAILALMGVGAFIYFDVGQYLTLETLKSNRDQLLDYAHQHYALSVFFFIGIYSLQTALSLPGAAILTLTGGLLFGTLLGTLYVNIAATVGATLAFLAARYLFRGWVEKKFGDRLIPLQEGFSKNAFSYLLTLRLVPLFPFVLVNLLSGLTRVRVETYVFATALGILPGSFVYANAGQQLGMINSLGEIISVEVLGAFALLAVFALVPIFYKKFRTRGVV